MTIAENCATAILANEASYNVELVAWRRPARLPTTGVICNICGNATRSDVTAHPDLLENPANPLRAKVTACSRCGNRIAWSNAQLWPESLTREVCPELFRE